MSKSKKIIEHPHLQKTIRQSNQNAFLFMPEKTALLHFQVEIQPNQPPPLLLPDFVRLRSGIHRSWRTQVSWLDASFGW